MGSSDRLIDLLIYCFIKAGCECGILLHRCAVPYHRHTVDQEPRTCRNVQIIRADFSHNTMRMRIRLYCGSVRTVVTLTLWFLGPLLYLLYQCSCERTYGHRTIGVSSRSRSRSEFNVRRQLYTYTMYDVRCTTYTIAATRSRAVLCCTGITR